MAKASSSRWASRLVLVIGDETVSDLVKIVIGFYAAILWVAIFASFFTIWP